MNSTFTLTNHNGDKCPINFTNVGKKILVDINPTSTYDGIETAYDFSHSELYETVTNTSSFTLEDPTFPDRFSILTRINTVRGDNLFILRDTKRRQLILVPNLDLNADFTKPIQNLTFPYYSLGTWVGKSTVTAEIQSKTFYRDTNITNTAEEVIVFLGSTDDCLGTNVMVEVSSQLMSFGITRTLDTSMRPCKNLLLNLYI